jgi:hypothetical protein
MKLVVLYQPHSEFAQATEAYLKEFKKLYPDKKLEMVDADSARGSQIAELYEALSYPALLALADDGQLLNAWLGPTLPLMNDVVAYLR